MKELQWRVEGIAILRIVLRNLLITDCLHEWTRPGCTSSGLVFANVSFDLENKGLTGMIRQEAGNIPKAAMRPLQVRWTGAGVMAKHPVTLKNPTMSAMAWFRQPAFSRRAINLALGFCVETLRKQGQAVCYVDDRDIDLLVT